jgi:Flp pilus assembly protein TadD
MNYGLTQMAKGDLAGALGSFEQALALTPNYSLLHINTGIALGALGRDAEAEQHFLRAMVLAPEDPQSHFYYSRWLAERHHRASTPEDLLNLSLEYYRAERFQDCIQAARQALRLNPNYAEAYNNIAAAYNSLGQYDDGIHAAQQAVCLKPDFTLARNNLAWALKRRH